MLALYLNRYGKGHAIFSISGALAHRVSEWHPTIMPSTTELEEKNSATLTPGRISLVFFFHKNSYEFLRTKQAGFFRTNPDHVDPKPHTK